MLLADYQTEHLFLLVGENPLPNYVAARTLLKPGGMVYFVHSDRTTEQKDSLLRELQQDSLTNFDCVELGKDESNANVIRTKIKEKIDQIPQDKNIGLNYTGGTKAMAVHAYLTVRDFRKNAIFSYLNPRKLKMSIDQLDNSSIELDVPSLDLSLEKLFNLHGLYLLKNFPPSSQPILPDLAAEIAKLYRNRNLADKWKDWCNQFPLKPNTDKKQIQLGEVSSDIKSRLDSYLQIPEYTPKIIDDEIQEIFGDFVGDKGFKNWLNGLWLESYVLKAIQDNAQKMGIKRENIQMNFYVTSNRSNVNTQTKKDNTKFELDVAFIKNYQLFAISCSARSGKGTEKHNLFEVYLRARELGGDEARLALICCDDDPEAIEEEIARFSFKDTKIKDTKIKDTKIKVFGREDLADIGDKIAKWVDEVEIHE